MQGQSGLPVPGDEKQYLSLIQPRRPCAYEAHTDALPVPEQVSFVGGFTLYPRPTQLVGGQPRCLDALVTVSTTGISRLERRSRPWTTISPESGCTRDTHLLLVFQKGLFGL